MDKKIVIGIILIVILALGGGGAFLYFQSQQPLDVPTPTPAPIVKQPEEQPILSAVAPSTLTASQSASLDIYVDTKGVKVDGFQFIATLDGTATPMVVDADPNVAGIQIVVESIPELTVATNSVIDQNGKQVVRFAMITATGTTGYATDEPIKVASIPVTPGEAGKIQLTFNPQNSRASTSSGGDDALFEVTDGTYTVLASTGTETGTDGLPAEVAQALATTSATTNPLALAPTVAPAVTTNPSCRLSCTTDNDCAAGLTCEFGLCVNPACSSSQTCSCTTTSLSAPVGTASPTPLATVTTQIAQSTTSTTSSTTTSITTATATPYASSTISGELAQADLPVSGSMENTILLLGAGLLFIGLGFVFAR